MSKRDNGSFFVIFVLFVACVVLFPIAAANNTKNDSQPIWKTVLWSLAGLGVAAAIVGLAVYLFNMPR